eukprot:GEMP01009980.1.p1 GENE.GEMP01009980.1~~GEMP01009980.1.p1  ORF type:complete len:893 (+),score=228.31 GEMP01009980.1:67-2745(+)
MKVLVFLLTISAFQHGHLRHRRLHPLQGERSPPPTPGALPATPRRLPSRHSVKHYYVKPRMVPPVPLATEKSHAITRKDQVVKALNAQTLRALAREERETLEKENAASDAIFDRLVKKEQKAERRKPDTSDPDVTAQPVQPDTADSDTSAQPAQPDTADSDTSAQPAQPDTADPVATAQPPQPDTADPVATSQPAQPDTASQGARVPAVQQSGEQGANEDDQGDDENAAQQQPQPVPAAQSSQPVQPAQQAQPAQADEEDAGQQSGDDATGTAGEEEDKSTNEEEREEEDKDTVEDKEEDEKGNRSAKNSLNKQVKNMEKKIEMELDSKALGDALGGIKKDIFELQQRVDAIADDMDDGVQIEKPKEEPWIEPLSTTMLCIINLTIQYFVVFTAAAVIRSFNSLIGVDGSNAEKVVNCARDTVVYAPMLCVLFLGARMRALQITQGEGNPQLYARYAMQACAWSVLIQTVLVLLIPVLTGEVVETDEDGNARMIKNAKGNACAGIITIIRYAAMLMLYAGFSIVCVAVFLMDSNTLGARNVWDDPRTAERELSPPVSPAVAATINLTIQFFAVYLSLAIVRSLVSFKQDSEKLAAALNTFQVAKATVDLAPMLCILFIGARMRALQMDPINGAPQPWAQNCFFLCAYSILAQTLMVLAVPVFGGGVEKGEFEGDVQLKGAPGAMTFVLLAIRYLALLANYGGFTVVIISILIIEHPKGRPTPDLSPAMGCVMNLTIQYFAVFLMLFVCQTLGMLMKRTNARVMKTLLAAKATVMFCPMLSVLFVGTRMRALQLTNQKGSPQCWAQDAMHVATYAVLGQLFMTLLIGALVGAPRMDKDGNPIVPEISSYFVKLVLETLKWVMFVALYGATITVVVSVLLIKKNSADCHNPWLF